MTSKMKFGIGAAFAGALALAVMGGAPQPAQAASKTGNFLLGLAAGVATTAVVASAIHANKKHRRYRRAYRPRPWTPEWYDYCAARYRSFNPETGYYRTYSGRYRFCR